LTHFNLNDWLHENPYPNGTLAQELQCYGLPYGGIGFASHLLTYYTIIMLSYQRSPWRPWKKNHHKWIDMTLSLFGLVASIILTVFTIIRCRNRWQFVVMATWKLILSVTFGILSFHAAMMVRPEKHQYSGIANFQSTADAIENREYTKVLWWLLLYIPGVVAGLSGLLSLVFKEIGHNHDVRIITEVFGIVIALPAALMLIFGITWMCSQCCGTRKAVAPNNSSMESLGRSTIAVGIMVSLVAGSATSVLAALYSDWVLGAIAGNLVGLPSGDVAPLYWGYILAKRLPFLSF